MLKSTAVSAVAALCLLTGSACSFSSKKEPPNTIHAATAEKIKGLDPIYADDLYAGDEVGRIYDGLLQYHYLKRPYTLIPALAESMPEVSKDGLTYTFKIKKGVVFQDDPCFKATGGKGREVEAEDFIFSFKRLADPKNASPGWFILDGKVVGLNEWREEASKSGAADYSKAVEGLKATDRYTLQIKLKQKSYIFLYNLAMTFAKVVPHEAVEAYGKEFISHPVGTGPYRLEEFNGASKIVYVKNPTFRKELYPSEGEPGDKAAGLLEDAGKPLPFADKIVVQIYVEQQPMWLNFLSGKLDYSVIPKDNFAQAISPTKELSPELASKGIRLEKRPSLDITHETLNMADPLIGKNKLLRQALSLALNIEPMIDLFYNGRAIAAQGPIPPGLAGYDEKFKNPYRQFNLARAKELLAKAGYPDGKGLPPIEYLTVASSTSRQMTEYLQKNFQSLGVTLKVNSYSWPEFQANLKNKKGQMWGYAWGADYPDAENFLQLFYSKNASPGPNDANYSNPEFDRLYEKSLLMSDTPERTATYQQMVKMVVEDAPWIFGVHRLAYTLAQPWFRNYKTHEFTHGMSKYYRVDPTLKK